MYSEIWVSTKLHSVMPEYTAVPFHTTLPLDPILNQINPA